MFSRFVTTVIAVATACVSIPSAQAALNHTAIVQKLHAIGITTSYGKCDGDGHNDPSGVLGSYNSNTNHFCISSNIRTTELMDEVVTHELTHVVQDCLGNGIASPNLGSITRYMSGGDSVHENILDQGLIGTLLKQNKMDHVDQSTKHMPSTAKFTEIEAYSLENSPMFVLKLLSRCGAE